MKAIAFAILMLAFCTVGLNTCFRNDGASFASSVAAASDAKFNHPNLIYGAPVRDDHYWTLMLGVANLREPKGLARVGIDCVFFNGANPVDKSGKLVTSIEYGKTVHEKVTGPPSDRAITRVECRVDYAYPV